MDSSKIINPNDRQYIDSVKDAILKDAMYCSVVQHRVSDTLAVGDAMPPLSLPTLAGDAEITLNGPRDKPLVLIFGSYT